MEILKKGKSKNFVCYVSNVKIPNVPIYKSFKFQHILKFSFQKNIFAFELFQGYLRSRDNEHFCDIISLRSYEAFAYNRVRAISGLGWG